MLLNCPVASSIIKHYGSVKPDAPLACPLLPLKKGSRGWDKKLFKVPLLKGDLGGSPGNK